METEKVQHKPNKSVRRETFADGLQTDHCIQFGRSDPNVYTLFAITVRSPFTGRSKNASIQYTLRPPAMSSSAK